mgnify:FL=1
MSIIINNLDKIFGIVLLMSASLYFRILLQIMGQAWIKTIAHTSTLALLPILTYIITNVISGNIALSLGMVGALSIVRFRNPVRSPLELSVYFGAITMGISAAVSLKWLLFLIGSVSFVILTLYLVNKLAVSLTNKAFFITSFSEGNALSTLHVVVREEIKELEYLDSLISKIKNDNEVSYTFASANFKILREIEDSIASADNIISVQLNR